MVNPTAEAAFVANLMIYRLTRSNFFWVLVLALLTVISLAGCAALPPADTSTSDWQTLNGQAVWTRGKQLDLAGEVIMSQAPGRSIVQFSKGPILLVQARIEGNRWEIQFPPQHRRYSGRGRPPASLIWLHLASAVEGKSKSSFDWSSANDDWSLSNTRTGESIQGVWNR